MSRVFIILGILLILLRPAVQRSTKDDSTYAAGVIQYHMADNHNPNFDVINSLEYCRLLQLFKKPLDLDIVIFPERGLAPIPSGIMSSPPAFIKYNRTGSSEDYQYVRGARQYSLIYRDFYKYRSLIIPKGAEYSDRSLCRLHTVDDVEDVAKFDVSSLTEYMACCSRKYSQYVVLTHYERKKCVDEPHCPSDDYFFYSTTIVYDRSGKLIARYHKHTGFDEAWIDEPRSLEPATFTTDFGVTFGLLIGYDIFDTRLIDYYIYEANVTDIILSTREPDMPFLLSVRDQIALVKKANVNLLIAGHGWDSDGGIYTGLNEPMGKLLENKTLTNGLLYKKVPKIGWQEMTRELKSLKSKDPIFDSFAVYRGSRESAQLDIMPKDWTLDEFAEAGSFNFSQLDFKAMRVNKELCVRTFCCRFRMEFSFKRIDIIEENEVFYTYFMVAMRSVNKLMGGSVVSIELCALMACQDNSPSSCGKSYDTREHALIYPWTFKSLNVTRRSNETYEVKNVYAPFAVSINDTVMKERHFVFSRVDNYPDDLEIRLKAPLRNLLAFGVLNRLFKADELPNEYFGLTPIHWLLKFLVTWKGITMIVLVIAIVVVSLFTIARRVIRNSLRENSRFIVTYTREATRFGEEEDVQEANESRGDTTNEQEDLGSPTRDDVTTPETVPLMELVRQQQKQESHDTDLEADFSGSMMGLKSDNDISEIQTDSTNRCSSGTITEYSTTSRVQSRNTARGPGALGLMRQVQESTDSKSSITSEEFSPGLVNTTFTLGQSTTDSGDDKEASSETNLS